MAIPLRRLSEERIGQALDVSAVDDSHRYDDVSHDRGENACSDFGRVETARL